MSDITVRFSHVWKKFKRGEKHDSLRSHPSSLVPSSRKVFVLGIDGVPCSLLREFMGQGIMPNLAEVVKNGTLKPMDASIPEVSSTSWSTFMTGVNPGRHNIYGFTELDQSSYKWRFPNFNDIKSPTLWDIAGRQGKASIVINLPSTYPARPLKGILTAGFVALDLQKATYPESAYQYLKGIDYKMDVDTQKAQVSPAALAEDIMTTFRKRKEAILGLMEKETWDLFIGTITETDRLHHYLWSALVDKAHPQHGFFIDFYRELDAFIGEIYGRLDDDTSLIMLSDHGFTEIKKEVYLNTWLRKKGYLRFKKEPPGSFEDIHGETKVFVLDPSRFYVHLKGKYPLGSVSNGTEHEDLRRKLKEDLLSLTVDGRKAIKSVFFKEELYKGPCYDDAPDVVALPVDGFDLKGAINKDTLTGRSLLTGGHTRSDATFYINRPIEMDGINIIDAGVTALKQLGIEEKGLEGRALG
ncbi:MAG TPA: hypothetical protein ENN18_03070 [Proteobacteria bacterium]|nr:hypothetical protein [Pseudomonadota bacterium]